MSRLRALYERCTWSVPFVAADNYLRSPVDIRVVSLVHNKAYVMIFKIPKRLVSKRAYATARKAQVRLQP